MTDHKWHFLVIKSENKQKPEENYKKNTKIGLAYIQLYKTKNYIETESKKLFKNITEAGRNLQ